VAQASSHPQQVGSSLGSSYRAMSESEALEEVGWLPTTTTFEI